MRGRISYLTDLPCQPVSKDHEIKGGVSPCHRCGGTFRFSFSSRHVVSVLACGKSGPASQHAKHSAPTDVSTGPARMLLVLLLFPPLSCPKSESKQRNNTQRQSSETNEGGTAVTAGLGESGGSSCSLGPHPKPKALTPSYRQLYRQILRSTALASALQACVCVEGSLGFPNDVPRAPHKVKSYLSFLLLLWKHCQTAANPSRPTGKAEQ